LDEATSALDAANERAVHELLHRSHATLISVAHRPSVTRYHDQVLELRGDGSWRLSAPAAALSASPARTAS
jgi:putative ATP-binding cassette transporter